MPTKKNKIASAFANEVGVDASDVTVTVEAGSVIITVEIEVLEDDADAAVSDLNTGILANADSLENALAAEGLDNVAVDTVSQSVIATAAPTAAPTPSPTASPTVEPTDAPTDAPTVEPTSVTTAAPTAAPTDVTTDAPTGVTTDAPTAAPACRRELESADDLLEGLRQRVAELEAKLRTSEAKLRTSERERQLYKAQIAAVAADATRV